MMSYLAIYAVIAVGYACWFMYEIDKRKDWFFSMIPEKGVHVVLGTALIVSILSFAWPLMLVARTYYMLREP